MVGAHPRAALKLSILERLARNSRQELVGSPKHHGQLYTDVFPCSQHHSCPVGRKPSRALVTDLLKLYIRLFLWEEWVLLYFRFPVNTWVLRKHFENTETTQSGSLLSS